MIYVTEKHWKQHQILAVSNFQDLSELRYIVIHLKSIQQEELMDIVRRRKGKIEREYEKGKRMPFFAGFWSDKWFIKKFIYVLSYHNGYVQII